MFQKLFNKIGYWLIRDAVVTDSGRHSMLMGALAKNRKTPLFDDSTGINGMNFIIYSAVGGKVISFNTYDPIRDKTSYRLYIIADGANFGEEIGQIITRESLSY